MQAICVIQDKRYDAGYSSKILGVFDTEEKADTFIQNKKRLDFIDYKRGCIIEYYKKLVDRNPI